jgi:integrase
MLYLYKKNNTYIYKRRIPHTNKFYTFNTTFKSYKKASKFVIIFNKLTRDLFEYIKIEGKELGIDFTEAYKVLNDYKEKALNEYSEFERERHNHIGKLFNIKKQDPLLGEITLNGAEPEVINTALDSFRTLAVGDYEKTKKHLSKHGKDIVARGTLELKSFYKNVRENKDYDQLLDFLSILLKTESEILREDYLRATQRFSTDNSQIASNYKIEEKQSFTHVQYKNNISISDIVNNFLLEECAYTEDMLKDSKSNASKVKKVVEIFTDMINDTKKEETIKSINLDLLKECFNIIPNIPIKPKNQIGSYSFYFAFKENSDASKNELRAIKTISNDLSSFLRFIKYLARKKFISADELIDLEIHLENIRKKIDRKVKNSELRDEQNKAPFKDEMLQKIFDKNHKPYSIIFKSLKRNNIKDKDILIARFLVPIVLFFTGARPSEITFLKTSDCEIGNIRGEDRIILYLEANELKDIKTKSSKRIVIVHDFLTKELNFMNFVKNAIKENREYLFNSVENFQTKVSVGFNREKDFLEGNISRIDEFNNLTYSLYSFRHTYKTHMLSKNTPETVIDKIQGHVDKKVSAGYFSITDELIDTINSFDKHKIINWVDIKIITDKF